ncbi:MAG: type II toxin-antitoxin system Phd/YefM family antitoxin [Thermomicrobiales bacterium]
MTISISDFRTHVSAVVRHVEETLDVVEITRRGKVVARLVPVPKKVEPRRIEDILARREQLSAHISSQRPKDQRSA